MSRTPVLLKSRVVKNPGSRGGIGYWDDHGVWHYGQRPMGRTRSPRQETPQQQQQPKQEPQQTGRRHSRGQDALKMAKGTALGGTALAVGLLTAVQVGNWIKTELPPKAVKDIQENLQKTYNYSCTDKASVFSTNKSRTTAWRTAESQLEFFHDSCPAWNAFVKKNGVTLDIASLYYPGLMTATYGQWSESPFSGHQSVETTHHMTSTLFHELTHAADFLMGAGDDYSSKDKSTPFASLVNDLKRTPEYRQELRRLQEQGNTEFADYRALDSEILARFGAAVLDHAWEKERPRPAPESRGERAARSQEAKLKADEEQWSPETIASLGPLYLQALRQTPPQKKQKDTQADAARKSWRTVIPLLKARIIKNPGSRGGIGYYDDHGVWRYGQRPMAHAQKAPREAPQRSPQRPPTKKKKDLSPAQKMAFRAAGAAVVLGATIGAGMYETHQDKKRTFAQQSTEEMLRRMREKARQQEQQKQEQANDEYRRRSKEERSKHQEQQRSEQAETNSAHRYSTTAEWEKGTNALRQEAFSIWKKTPRGAHETLTSHHASELRRLQLLIKKINASAPAGVKPVTLATIIRDARKSTTAKSFRDYYDDLSRCHLIQRYVEGLIKSAAASSMQTAKPAAGADPGRQHPMLSPSSPLTRALCAAAGVPDVEALLVALGHPISDKAKRNLAKRAGGHQAHRDRIEHLQRMALSRPVGAGGDEEAQKSLHKGMTPHEYTGQVSYGPIKYGSRGGHWFVNGAGHIEYGEPPTPFQPTPDFDHDDAHHHAAYERLLEAAGSDAAIGHHLLHSTPEERSRLAALSAADLGDHKAAPAIKRILNDQHTIVTAQFKAHPMHHAGDAAKGGRATAPLAVEDMKRALDAWHAADEEEREGGVVWYATARALCKQWSRQSGVSFLRCAAILAVTSQRTGWNQNLKNAEYSIFGNLSLQDTLEDSHIAGLPDVRRKVYHILHDPRPLRYVTGDKVRSFLMNIVGVGNGRVVTIDRHVYGIMGVPKAQQTTANYNYYRRLFIAAAHQVGVPPDVFQAATWAWYVNGPAKEKALAAGQPKQLVGVSNTDATVSRLRARLANGDSTAAKSFRAYAVALTKSATAPEVQHPGSRGGHGYYDKQGHWQYGDAPQVGQPSRVARGTAPKEAPHKPAEKSADAPKGPTPNPWVQQVAKDYVRQYGIADDLPERPYAKLDQETSKRIADAYEANTHKPHDPAVKRSYVALAKEIKQQYEHALRAGMSFEPWGKNADPYATSEEMRADVARNRHLGFFQGGDMPDDHPLKQADPEHGLSYNDMFRAVHDLFGHAAGGFEFGPRGEENAWIEHRRMFSPEARPAMTNETRGQNSWVNFSKYLRRPDGSIPKKGEEGYVPPAERPFAAQKAALLPHEFTSRDDL